MTELKVGQIWEHPKQGKGRISSLRDDHSAWLVIQRSHFSAVDFEYLKGNGWTLQEDIKVGHVYKDAQGELYESLEADRIRHLRSGVTLRHKGFPREFTYLGRMPRVGDVWARDAWTTVATVTAVEKNAARNCNVEVSFSTPRQRYVVSLEFFLKDAAFASSAHEAIEEAVSHQGPSIAKLINSGYLPPTFAPARQQGKSFLQEKLDEVRRYTAIMADTYWVSRKGRYVRIVQVTDKIVRLRDAITNDPLGFRALEDFARTYQPRLKVGERWVYNGYSVEIKGSGGRYVSIWNDFLGVKSLLVKEFLARASFVGEGPQDTQQFGRAMRPKASPKLTFGREGFLADFKTFSEYCVADVKDTEGVRAPFKVAVGQVWSSDTRDLRITAVNDKRVGYKTARGSSGSMSIATLLERYTLVEVKPISGSSLFMARDYIKCSQFTLEAPGLRSTFANKEGFIDFCRAMVEAEKCQQST